MAELIRLGTLTLRYEVAQGARISSSGAVWTPLDRTILEQVAWDEESKSAVELVQQLLKDSHLGMACEQRTENQGVCLRISVLANDDGLWSVTNSYRAKRLRILFSLLDRSWDGGGEKLLQPSAEDLQTGIQGLYALIENPPDPTFGQANSYEDLRVFSYLQAYENPPGVKTMLYKYQIRSLARMLQMETSPAILSHPDYVRLEDPTGEPFFVSQQMDIRRHTPRYQLEKGGILCEQMGVGKTLICLALVLISKHQHTQQPPRPPIPYHELEGLDEDDARDIMESFEKIQRLEQTVTNVALRTYPTPVAQELREVLEITDTALAGTPSLASFCADIVAMECPAAWGVELSPGIRNLLDERKCIYHRFRRATRRLRSAKKERITPVERLWLSGTTLAIVPPILVPQWLAEAEKHLEPGALSILVIKDGTKDPLPPVDVLMRYDMVLMSIDRFRRENHRDQFTWNLTTPLVEARWKRIILDEGNIANNIRSDAMILADTLSIERRWIVSGTPTTGLKQGTEGAFESFLAESEGATAKKPRARATMPKSSGKWTKADLQDVSRIGNMLSGFLGSSMFSPEAFRRQVTKPLRKAEGPAFGAVERLRQIMSSVMVKHRPGVIDQEVALPESEVAVQTVHLGHLQRLTYNALTALVGSNVWTSQGEDIDYFLHPRNTAQLNQVVANLHLACMWFSSSDMDLESAYSRTIKHLEKSKNLTEEQRAGLQEAIRHMRAAIDTPAWSEWMRNGAASIPCEVPVLPMQILDSWSDSPDSDNTMLDIHALRRLRELNHRGAAVNDVARAGWDERANGPHAEALLKVMEKAEKSWRAGQQVATGDDKESAHKHDTKAAAEKSRAPKIVKAKRKSGVDARLDTAAKNAKRAAQLTSTAPRPLPSLLNITTASSKVSYVVRSILASPDDKFVVFGTYEEIGHVTEALDLAGISSVYVGAHVAREMRKANLDDFKGTSIQVCLLELNFAARGLTLTMANRMIFLAPVWSLDVQAQAIKRIHRIGQVRATHIDILVTEGTFEEDIVRRETNARSNEEEKRYSRALIENPRFVYAEGEDMVSFPVSLVPAGLASEEEKDDLARAVKDVTAPPSSRAVSRGTSPASEASSLTPLSTRESTPIVTPGTPLETKRPFEAIKAEEGGRKKRRVMFAD